MINKTTRREIRSFSIMKSFLWYILLMCLSLSFSYFGLAEVTLFLIPLSFLYDKIMNDTVFSPAFIFVFGFIYDIAFDAPYGFHATLFLISIYVYDMILGSLSLRKNAFVFLVLGTFFVVWLYIIQSIMIVTLTNYSLFVEDIILGFFLNILFLGIILKVRLHFVSMRL